MPPLIYTWRIAEISRQTAPFVEAGNMLVRDPTKLGWLPLERTDAWHDDDGLADYKLDCVLLDVPPKRSSTTALMDANDGPDLPLGVPGVLCGPARQAGCTRLGILFARVPAITDILR
jgi:hypothetical protein